MELGCLWWCKSFLAKCLTRLRTTNDLWAKRNKIWWHQSICNYLRAFDGSHWKRLAPLHHSIQYSVLKVVQVKMIHNVFHQDCYEMTWWFLDMAWIREMHFDAFDPCPFGDTKHPVQVGNHKTSIVCRCWIEKPCVERKKEWDTAANEQACVLIKHFLWSAGVSDKKVETATHPPSRHPPETSDSIYPIARFLAFFLLMTPFAYSKLILQLILTIWWIC